MTSDKLQGRIMALEVLMRGFIVDMSMRTDDPLATLDRWRDNATDFVFGLKPTDAQPQEVLSEAVRALTENLLQAEQRLRGLQFE